MNPPRAYCCPCCKLAWGALVDGRLSGGAFEVLERSFVRCVKCGHVQRWDTSRDARRNTPLDNAGVPKQE
jgi:RNase P subunit RPR2